LKKIIHCFCLDIDATKTAELVDLNRNTVNKYFMLFRESIELNQLNLLQSQSQLQPNSEDNSEAQLSTKLTGTVELDESYFGRSRARGFHGKLKRGRGTNKIPIFGIIQRQDETGYKHVFTQRVPNCKSATLLPIIQRKVDVSAIVNTDMWKSYDALVGIGYTHLCRVNHGKNEFALKGEDGATVTVNGIESFWSFTKRRLVKFNGHMNNLNLHLKECEWRWNHSPPERSQSRRQQKQYLFDLEQDLWKILNTYLRLKRKLNF
jgi:transposase